MSAVVELRQGEPDYPGLLYRLSEPPRVLYATGELSLLKRKAAAIIGSRTPSLYGMRIGYEAAQAVARAGAVVVSGLARGLDSRAHRAALDHGGGTIAVVGCGFDHCYPRGNEPLQNEIRERGLLLSEYAPDTEPRKYHFPSRNRIIAALSSAVLVVEGRATGGTSSTAKWANEMNVPVLAVPGRITDELASGPNQLLQNGAKPYLTPEDLLFLLGFPVGSERPRRREPTADLGAQQQHTLALRGAEATLFDLVRPEPQSVDRIVERSGLPPGVALAALSTLELQGLIEQLPGKRFALAS